MKKINNYEFYILDTDDNNQIIEYEKKFYEAHIRKFPNSWAINNMQIIDGCRLKPNIPYDNLELIAVRVDGELIAGIKANFDKNNFQLYEMGFNINDNDKKRNTCEGMNFFALSDDYDQLEFFNLMETFSQYYMEQLEKKGIEVIYGTTRKRTKIIYLRMGFEIIDELDIEGEKQYLIRYNFKTSC